MWLSNQDPATQLPSRRKSIEVTTEMLKNAIQHMVSALCFSAYGDVTLFVFFVCRNASLDLPGHWIM